MWGVRRVGGYSKRRVEGGNRPIFLFLPFSPPPLPPSHTTHPSFFPSPPIVNLVSGAQSLVAPVTSMRSAFHLFPWQPGGGLRWLVIEKFIAGQWRAGESLRGPVAIVLSPWLFTVVSTALMLGSNTGLNER